MDRHFDEELQNVKKKLMDMAAMVEETIRRASGATRARRGAGR